MKIIAIKVLRGPNYWSNYRKQLIDMKLDIGELEQLPSNKLPGFAERLEELIPTLYEHRCSEGRPGGFFERLQKGTWMGHIVEHIALELQTLAGMECGYGRTRTTGNSGVYHVVFDYEIDKAGIYAGKAAVNIVEAICAQQSYDIAADIAALEKIRNREGLGPSTKAIVNEARKRDIPVKALHDNMFFRFGYGKYQQTICATLTSKTNNIAVDIACNKDLTRKVLQKGFIPIPKGKLVRSLDELEPAINEIGFPLVIKPSNGNHGRGVKVDIQSVEEASKAFYGAKEYSSSIIVEQYIKGHDFRFLVVNYKLQAAARRTAAMVIGDGQHSIRELVDEVNTDPRRGEGHENILSTIKLDEFTVNILAEKNLTIESIIPKGEIIFLKDAANLSAGGTASDVTDLVHPLNVQMVERVARLINLDLCGIDMIAEDISSPITESGGAIIEVNAAPGLRMHLSPSKGTPRNVADPIVKMLFPPGKPYRIPIVAVTGTNGKTTTTRLIAHLAKVAGHTVGYTSTDGIYIDGQLLYKGDCSGPSSAEAVLSDPLIDFAVLECARGGILRSGLAFDKCDISIVTNVAADHLGMEDIETQRDLANVKMVVPRSTSEDGFAILNADDDLVYRMRNELDCKVALFSLYDNNERIKRHCAEGGMAAIIEKGHFTLCKGEWKLRVARVKDVPLTQEGRVSCMIKNILPAILAAAARDIDISFIRQGLMEFIPGPEFTPGRMNIFKIRDIEVIVDYVHNLHGYQEMASFMKTVDSPMKIGIITAPGDRKDEDIIETGRIAAKIFDRIIIKHDKDLRGRAKDNLTELLAKGIEDSDSGTPYEEVSDETDSLTHAIQTAVEGACIVISSEYPMKTVEFLRKEAEAVKLRG